MLSSFSIPPILLQDVVDKILDIASQSKIDYVGHRVVHGGELFRDVTEITEESLKNLKRTEGMRPLNVFFMLYLYFLKTWPPFTILYRSMSSDKQ